MNELLDKYAAGLDALPTPVSVFDVHGSVLFSNWASTKVGPLSTLPFLSTGPTGPTAKQRQVSDLDLPSSLVPVCTWTERESRGCSDGEARILSCNAFLNNGLRKQGESGPPAFIVTRHDITSHAMQHQFVEVEAALLGTSLSEAQEHNKRLQCSAKEMADSVAELRTLMDFSKQQQQQQQQGEGAMPQWSPGTASHISAVMASFDACLRRFRSIAAPPEKHAPIPSNLHTKTFPHSNSYVLSSTDSPPSRRSAPQVPGNFIAAAMGSSNGGAGMPHSGSGSANSKQHSSGGNHRRPKQQQQQLLLSKSGSTGVASTGGSPHCAASSGASNQSLLGHALGRRFSSGPELLLGEEEKLERSGGGCRGVNKSSHQLSARVLQLHEQLAQLQSKHNAVCVHAAELAQENHALRQQLAQALGSSPPKQQQQQQQLQGPCLIATTACGPRDAHLQQQQQQQQEDVTRHMQKAQSYSQELVTLWSKDRAQAATADSGAVGSACAPGHEKRELAAKQAFDMQLHKAQQEAVQLRADYDKYILGANEMGADEGQQGTNQLHKMQADAHLFKAMYDKGEVDAAEQKLQLDAELSKACKRVAELQALVDKGKLDALEQKQEFDAQLHKASTDAAEFKAMYDKSELDAVEQKQEFDAQLHKASADATEFKAMYDKGSDGKEAGRGRCCY